MKKIILTAILAVFVFASCEKESLSDSLPETQRDFVAADESGSNTIPPAPDSRCRDDISVVISANWVPTNIGGTEFHSGPILPGNSNNSLACWRDPNGQPLDVAIVTFDISLPNISFEAENNPNPCVVKPLAYLEIKNLKGTPQYVKGYGVIHKNFPITTGGISSMNFNINYFLRCDIGTFEFDNDPTGSNGPYLDPLGLNITGDKNFAFRVVVRYFDVCKNTVCNSVTQWKFFEWVI